MSKLTKLNSNRMRSVVGTALLAGLAMGTTAQAEEDRKFGWTWTVTAASDYMFRGISYTGSDATVNSYLELTYGIAYLGFWTSNIDTCDAAGCLGPIEQDFYLGIRPTTGPVTWDIAALYYTYQTKGAGFSWRDTDYVEFKAAGTISPVTNLSLTGAFYYTPEQGLASPENISIEGTAAYTLPAIGMFTPTISGQVGYSDASTNGNYGTESSALAGGKLGYWNGDDSYVYWNAGVKLAVEKFTFDLRYWDTNVNENAADLSLGRAQSDERFFFSVAVTLP